jgi:3-phenylpropionate/trans-cinnamate dioxygenase ferredoxin subunit
VTQHVAARLEDVPEGAALAVEIEGVELALVRDGDVVYAITDECSHAAIPLSEGEVEGTEIECWLHGSKFDLRTGKPVNLPATEPVQTYPTTIEGDTVLVDLSSSTTPNRS